MSAPTNSEAENARTKRRIAGVIAIAFVVAFAILLFVGVFSLIELFIADLAVLLVANLIFRRLGSKTRF